VVIVWSYGAIQQTQQGFGPVWNWSGPQGAVAAPATGPVCGRIATVPAVGGVVATVPAVAGTVGVEEC
jgi:hypothetical protein